MGPEATFTNDINPRAPFPKGGKWIPTLVKRGATIGANATILPGVTIGKWSMIGAGSVVTRDVPDFAIVRGNPARHTGWICICGRKLEFDNKKAVCSGCGREYRIKDGRVEAVS
ncbi:MAG TPA: N-acetyltransferase [candidate division WOR-3 bacterium]|uniref:N-acetyltransferase n=1 Tax=candidate division WOR-3 bacterium TaxID=2052148 RepID=A0A7C0ZEB1_UNCW3|nr:N-acetyltransferase [candidate division WOR-3 bacterium]